MHENVFSFGRVGDCSSPFHSARETRYGCEVLNTTCSTREGLRFRNSEESFFPLYRFY